MDCFNNNYKPRSRKRLYAAVGASSLLYVCTGCVMSWTSPAVVKMSIPADQAGWLGSLYALGAAVGPSVNVLLLDRVGRRGTMVFLGVSFFTHWLILGLTSWVPLMYLARLIGGLGVGGTFACVSLYVAEVSDEKVRGALGSLNQFFVCLGILMENSVGPWVSSLTLILISGAVVIFSALAVLWIPESPHYLLLRSRKVEARNSLSWLRSRPPPFALNRELDSVQESLEEHHKGGVEVMKLLKSRQLWLCFYLMFVQQISGFNAVVSFMQELFEAARLRMPSVYPSIGLSGVNLLASLFTPFLVKQFGLKTLIIVSSVLMGLALLILGGYFFFLESGSGVSKVDFIPVATLIVYNIMFCVGSGPVPWTIVGEMFEARVKGLACCLIALEGWTLTFLVVRGYGWMSQYWGQSVVLTVYGILVLLASLVLIRFLPETRGLSLQDIQDLMSSTKPNITEETT